MGGEVTHPASLFEGHKTNSPMAMSNHLTGLKLPSSVGKSTGFKMSGPGLIAIVSGGAE